MKRAADLALSVSGLVALAVLAPFIALFIKMDSAGPVLLRQRRVGKDEAPFCCYKFRTMLVSTPQVPTHEAPVSNVTRVGKVLRASKLDELPQLINVLQGEMSIVGPRPCLETQLELISRRRDLGVMKVLPGITGLAQVRGIDMSNPARLALVDAEYIQRMSTAFDLKIMYATAIRGAARAL